MECPECGCRRLLVDVVFSGTVACRFEDQASVELTETAELDSHWDETSGCSCPRCHWTGRLLEAGMGAARDEPAGPDVAADVSRLLEETRLAPSVRSQVARLLKEYESLQQQVDLLQRLSRRDERDHGDTHIF